MPGGLKNNLNPGCPEIFKFYKDKTAPWCHRVPSCGLRRLSDLIEHYIMDSGLISTEGPREKYSVRVVGFHVVLTAGPLTILSVTLLSDWFVPCTSTVDQNVTGPYHRRFSAVVKHKK